MPRLSSAKFLKAAYNNLDFALQVGDADLIEAARAAFRAARNNYLFNAAV